MAEFCTSTVVSYMLICVDIKLIAIMFIYVFVLFVLQGVDLEKLMEASVFICRYLNRRPASKVVQALHSNKL